MAVRGVAPWSQWLCGSCAVAPPTAAGSHNQPLTAKLLPRMMDEDWALFGRAPVCRCSSLLANLSTVSQKQRAERKNLETLSQQQIFVSRRSPANKASDRQESERLNVALVFFKKTKIYRYLGAAVRSYIQNRLILIYTKYISAHVYV